MYSMYSTEKFAQMPKISEGHSGYLSAVGTKYVVPSSSPSRVSLKPDRKTADKTAKINSDGRASCMTARPHRMSSAHQTVTLLVTVAN